MRLAKSLRQVNVSASGRETVPKLRFAGKGVGKGTMKRRFAQIPIAPPKETRAITELEKSSLGCSGVLCDEAI